MNTPRATTPTVPTTAVVVALPIRQRRERDFGIGYGNSSGYATERRYVRDSFQPRFRCA